MGELTSTCHSIPRFPRGAVVQRRDVLDGQDWVSYPVRVVVDTPGLTALYLSHGTRLHFGGGPFSWGRHPWAAIGDRWLSAGVLQLYCPGRAHSVWVTKFLETGQFRGWYVNLEAPLRREADGFSTLDHEIDLIIPANSNACTWKDQDKFEHRVASGHFSLSQADEIRAEAMRVAQSVSVGTQWWDLAWSRWTAPASWGPLATEDEGIAMEGSR
jgi:hypothetical protein